MDKALSFIEMMVVLIIIGILAALAIPNFSTVLEMNKIRTAEVNLKTIYNAEKRFKLRDQEQKYYTVDEAVSDKTDAINRNLSLRINEPHFSYDIQKVSGGGYKAVATRLGGACAQKTMSISNENSTVTKDTCKEWGN